MPLSGMPAQTSLRRQRSDFLFSTTSASSSESGRKRAIGAFLDTLVMKLRRPHSGLSVCSTSDLSPTLVTERTMNSELCTIGAYSVWPPMNSRMMEVGGMAAISAGLRALTLVRNSSSWLAFP